VRGRLQRFDRQGVDVVVDVGHNPQAARELAAWLRVTPIDGAVHAVYAALGDKDVNGVVEALAPQVTHWHLAGLPPSTPPRRPWTGSPGTERANPGRRRSASQGYNSARRSACGVRDRWNLP
jgi:hypothetical protein